MSGRWSTKAAVVLVGCVLSIPIAEGVVRAVVPQPQSWLAIYRHHPTLPIYTHMPNVQTLIDTGESRWTICTDTRGFRTGCGSTSQDDRPFALWLGDSFAFGQGVDFEQSFVGRLTADPDSRLRYLNAAVNGYGPVQYRETLESLLACDIRPTAVFVETFLGNDFIDCLWSKDLPTRDGILGNERSWKEVVSRHSHLYRLVAAHVHRVRAPEFRQDFLDHEMAEPGNWIEGELGRAEQIYREEFARLARLCLEHGIAMAVLVVPRSTMVEALQTGTAKGIEDPAGQTLAWKHARSIFEELGIRVLDLTPEFVRYPLGELYFPIDGHFTPRGNAIVAEAIRRDWLDLIDPR